MMRFGGLYIHNFRSHADTVLVLGVFESLFVGGDNQDIPEHGGNGTGKSLIYDALYWCLWDTTIRGFSKDAVVGHSDSWTSVITRWYDDDNHVIDIARYRRHPKFQNQAVVEIDGVDVSKTTTAKKSGTNAYIKQLFGLDAVAFLHTVVFSKSRPSLCDERPNERRKLLSHVIGLDRVDEALKAAQTHRREIEKAVQRVEIKLAQERTTEHEIEAALASTLAALEHAQEQQRLAEERYQQAVVDTQARVEALAAEHRQAVIDQVARRTQFEEQQPLLAQLQELQQQLAAAKDSESKSMLTYSLAAAKSKDDRQQLTQMVAQAGIECPTCHQLVGPAHVRKVTYLLKQGLQQIDTKKVAAAKRVKAARTAVKYLEQEISALQQQVDHGLLQAIAAGDRQIDMLVRQLAQLQRMVPEPPTFDAGVLEQSLADLQARLVVTQSKLADLEQTLAKNNKQLAIASYWVKGFGQKGLKAYILGNVLDRLQQTANQVLEQLSGARMRVRWVTDTEVDGVLIPDRLDLMVERAGQDDCEYHYCSLGEQARLWIAMEWAVGEIAMGKVDIRLVDECFDGLSKHGVERAIRLVSGEATERRLICISHRDEVQKFFNRRATVVMRNGISSLEGRTDGRESGRGDEVDGSAAAA